MRGPKNEAGGHSPVSSELNEIVIEVWPARDLPVRGAGYEPGLAQSQMISSPSGYPRGFNMILIDECNNRVGLVHSAINDRNSTPRVSIRRTFSSPRTSWVYLSKSTTVFRKSYGYIRTSISIYRGAVMIERSAVHVQDERSRSFCENCLPLTYRG